MSTDKQMTPAHSKWIPRLRGLLRPKRRPPSLAAFLTGPTLRFAEAWGWEENIVGLCLGWRKHDPCLTFLVRSKIAEGRLNKKQVIPELLRQKSLKLEIPTKVLEVGNQFELQAPFTGTLKSGLPIGHEHGFASGTLGFLVQRPSIPTRSLLSCAHVLAWTRKAIFPLPKAGDFIEQPVSLDNDPEHFRAARLSANFTDLTHPNVTSDFAIAEIPNGVASLHNGPARVSARSNPQDFPPGLQLRMFGRVSGLVNGRLRGMQASVRIPTFGNVNFPHWFYQNVFVYEVSSSPGDSGAGIVESATGDALGLHVSGNGNGLGLFYPVKPIFDKFGLRFPT